MPLVGDIAELDLFLSGQYSKFQYTFGFECINAAGTFAGLASGFKTALVKNGAGGLFANCASSVSSVELRIRDVKPGTAATYDYSYASVAGADVSGQELPPQCALVLSWFTALAGRSYRGRTYLTGFTEQTQDNGVWDSTHLTNVTGIITQMLTVYGSGGTDGNWQFGVISRYLNGAPRITPVITPVTSGVARAYVYTQRRRTNLVGQ